MPRAAAASALLAVLVSASVGAARPPVPPGPAAVPPGRSVTGTWSGSLAVGGTARAFTVQFHRRSAGKLMGYVLGGTSARTITGGFQSATDVAFQIELMDPGATRTFRISGTMTGGSLVGTADDGTAVTPVRWDRVHQVLDERSFLFARAPSGGSGPSNVIELAVVRAHGSGRFVSGGYVGQADCGLFACGGGMTAFAETLDAGGNEVIEIGLETGGSCPGTGTVHATFNTTTKLYSGTYSFNDCVGPNTGDVIGAKTTRTTSADAASVLNTFARLADDLEAGATFTAPYAPFSPDYLHNSETLADRLNELNAEVATYRPIDVVFSRFRSLHTIDEPNHLPDRPLRFGVDVHDRRSGMVGGVPVVYRDVDTRDGHDALAFLIKEGGAWVEYGNQIVHDLPLAGYSFGADHVVAPTAGGNIYVSIGPWGGHVLPHTGHVEGNAKADWQGLYAHRLDQLTELAGNGNGVCEADEVCGIAQADLEARIVTYVAPANDFEITEVRLERLADPGAYYGTDEQWRVRGRLATYEYDFDHLRRVSPDLRDAMIAAGYVDPWTVHSPSDNLITAAVVVLSRGASIAQPQTVAEPVAGHPGYYTGKFSAPQTPWQQMEFFTFNSRSARQESFYTWLSPTLRAQLAGVLQAEGLNPLSFRYHQAFLTGIGRMWRAEMALSNQESMSFDDYSNLFSALGGWWETTGAPCDGVSTRCDELFSIFPIRKDTVFYDSAAYHSAAVSYLAIHRFRGEVPATRFGEVITPSSPDPVAGTLVFKWRDVSGGLVGYQGASYRLDAAGRLLRIGWGPTAATEGAVTMPPIPASTDVCNGTTLTCHNHVRDEGNL